MPRRPSISLKIIESLEKKFKTQKALAEYLGVTPRAIRYWKTKTYKPKAERAPRIADAKKIKKPKKIPPIAGAPAKLVFTPIRTTGDPPSDFYSTFLLSKKEIASLLSQVREMLDSGQFELVRFITKIPKGFSDGYPDAGFMSSQWFFSGRWNTDQKITEEFWRVTKGGKPWEVCLGRARTA